MATIKAAETDPRKLQIIFWPDPRLKKMSMPIKDFGAWLKPITERMFELMREAHGVGLAAPQIGINLRLFVINTTGDIKDDRVYINPILSDAEDEVEEEEGCLSLPDIRVNVLRSKKLRLSAQDQEGNHFEQTEDGFVARVWQHENDHLNGMLLLDRMGPVARMTHRKQIKAMEDKWIEVHGKLPGKK